MSNERALTQAACLLANRFRAHSQELCVILAPHSTEGAPYPFEAVNEWSRGTVGIRNEADALIGKLKDAQLRGILHEIVLLCDKSVNCLRQKNH